MPLGKIKASEVKAGDTLVGLDGYVSEDAETGNGYLTYPSTGGRYDAAMPEDTVLITFFDNAGEENYLIVHPDFLIQVQREGEL